MMMPSVKDFGCKGDGVTDDTVDFQLAINSCGGVLFIEPGTYFTPGGLTISEPLYLQGFGMQSAIKIPQTCLTGLNVATAAQVTFKDFAIYGDPNVSNWSSLIYVAPAGAFNQPSRFSNLYLVQGGIGMKMANAAWWVIDGCFIDQPSQIGVYVGNTENADDGDSTICNSLLSCPIGSALASPIWQVSSGGLRVVNNKIIGGVHGYVLELAPGAVTSDLIVVANSFELQGNDHLLGLPKDAAHFANIIITGNQMWNSKYGINLPAYQNKVIGSNAITS